MNWTQIIGMLAGILTASSLLPQLIKTIKLKHADDVSFGMLIVLMMGLMLWIVYGIQRDDMPIIVTNSFSLLLNFTMMGMKIKYGKKKPPVGKVHD